MTKKIIFIFLLIIAVVIVVLVIVLSAINISIQGRHIERQGANKEIYNSEKKPETNIKPTEQKALFIKGKITSIDSQGITIKAEQEEKVFVFTKKSKLLSRTSGKLEMLNWTDFSANNEVVLHYNSNAEVELLEKN